FNNWIFDKARKPGDTGIVETSYGYHIMYFIGKGEDYWIAQVKDTLVTNAYDDFMKQLEKKYKYKEHSVGLSFTGKLG
ncbi:MAG: peptidylprolyl isomerase, partial [Clostridiales bacterium]|nr:peptidylprolyl isomerase [Clostridiales bacterium]